MTIQWEDTNEAALQISPVVSPPLSGCIAQRCPLAVEGVSWCYGSLNGEADPGGLKADESSEEEVRYEDRNEP